jgi:hypothetical protein
MQTIQLTPDDIDTFEHLKKLAGEWAKNHQWEVGAIEAALGGACVCWAVQNGVLTLGADLLGTAFAVGPSTFSMSSALTTGALGAFGGQLLGSIGVAAAGTAICIPAGVLSLGGAFVFGALGYTATDIFESYVNAIPMAEFFREASVLSVGIALMVDGARRIVGDDRARHAFARMEEHLVWIGKNSCPIVASTFEELCEWSRKAFSIPQTAEEQARAAFGSSLGTIGGMAAGASLGAGSVTVLGSSALGGLALSVGIVTAPIWPVIALGAAGAAAGYGCARLLARATPTKRASSRTK